MKTVLLCSALACVSLTLCCCGGGGGGGDTPVKPDQKDRGAGYHPGRAKDTGAKGTACLHRCTATFTVRQTVYTFSFGGTDTGSFEVKESGCTTAAGTAKIVSYTPSSATAAELQLHLTNTMWEGPAATEEHVYQLQFSTPFAAQAAADMGGAHTMAEAQFAEN